MNKGLDIVEQLLTFSEEIRYVAIYKNCELLSKEKNEGLNHSAAESDRYEELLVNPTLLKLASQRGNIDCGGLKFIIIGYGNFYQLIHEINEGHISVCIEKSADINATVQKVLSFLKSKFNYYLYKL